MTGSRYFAQEFWGRQVQLNIYKKTQNFLRQREDPHVPKVDEFTYLRQTYVSCSLIKGNPENSI